MDTSVFQHFCFVVSTNNHPKKWKCAIRIVYSESILEC